MKRVPIRTVAGFVSLALLIAAAAAAAAVGAGQSGPLSGGIDRSGFDPAVPAGQDFFLHVNGNWIKQHPIPPDKTRWGSFAELAERNSNELHDIFDQLVSGSATLDEDHRKLRDFYLTATDEAKLEQQGVKPLQDELDKIAAINDRAGLLAQIARFHSTGSRALFSFFVGIDDKNSTQYIISLGQGGIGLPERNYYVGADDYAKRMRAKYHDHVARMLALLGDDEPSAASEADAVLRIETKLAEASRTPVQLRDVEALYNKRSLAELHDLCPAVDWNAYFKDIGAGDGVKDVIVDEPEFLQRVNELLSGESMDNWKTYLRWHLIHEAAPYLSDRFVNANFDFFGRTLTGVKALEPRWKRAVQTIDRLMGEDLGKIYVERYFSPDAKRRMQELVSNVIEAYRQRIRTRDWMSPETRKQAEAKLDLVMRKIGYPDKWRDYSALQIQTDSYVQNVLRAREFNFNYRLSHLGKPVDKTEWGMSPPTVNAYYNPTMNEIVFPAGILQPPFFNPNADDAVNYGGIGAVIGHELTHGFDDQGSLFDAQGNLKNWWTKQDKERFHARAEALAKEYDACVAIDDLHVNGHLTLGENIADLGGVTISLAAYRRSLNGHEAPVIDGFTGEQRFFIGFAQIWRGESRPEALRVSLRTDPHSPVQFRCDVLLSNIDDFYKAFHIKPGDRMFRPPDQRVAIW